MKRTAMNYFVIFNNFIKNNPFKLIFLLFFSILFIYLYVPPSSDALISNWIDKYYRMGVIANSYPGGDSRNIQNVAYCKKLGFSYHDDTCKPNLSTLRSIYNNSYISIPHYNYPPILADIYGFFGDNSETFFLLFWRLNAILIFFTVLFYSFWYNYKLFPLIIFSPIALLAVERGNTDATVLAIVFLPMLFFKSDYIRGFFIGLAASLKLFPVFGFTFLIKEKISSITKILFGALLVSPLLLYSFYNIPKFLGKTGHSTGYSFGLLSIQYFPTSRKEFEDYLVYIYTSYVFYLLIALVFIYYLIKKRVFYHSVVNDLNKMSKHTLDQLSVSMAIYLLVFIVYTSWAYRFIFIIPAFIILSMHKNILSKISWWLILLTMLIPFAPYGDTLFNLPHYLLAPILVIISYYIFIDSRKSKSISPL